MAGRTLSEAVDNYIRALTTALHCITEKPLSRPPSKALALNTPYATSLAKMDPIQLAADPRLNFSAGQNFTIVEPRGNHPRERYKISTLAYFYEITMADDRQVLSFHWDSTATPSRDGDQAITIPHVHVGPAIAGRHTTIRPGDFHKVHVPTGRVSLEGVIWLLIDQLGVPPRKQRWRDVLKRTEDDFTAEKTW